MTIRSRPVLDRKHRPRWQDELRTQQLTILGFALAIALALGIFGAAAWNGYWESHLRPVAVVAGESYDRGDLAQRESILTAEAIATVTELQAQLDGGPRDQLIQQQIDSLSAGFNQLASDAAESLVDGAVLAERAADFGVSVSDDAVDAEVAERMRVPERIRARLILVEPEITEPADEGGEDGAGEAEDGEAEDGEAEPAEPTEEQLADARAAAEAARARVEDGEDFAEVATDVSDHFTAASGGLLGWFGADDTANAEYFEALAGADPGDVVGPVETDGGFAVLELLDRREATAAGPLDDLLEREGVSDEAYREYVRSELLLESYREHFLDEVVGSETAQRRVARIGITPATGDPVPEERARHILVQPLPDAENQSEATDEQWENARTEIEEVRARLTEPDADWYEIAAEVSDDPGSGSRGGDLGWYDPEASPFVEEFSEALAELEVGEISEPVRTEFGWHVIQKTGVRESPEELAERLVSELRGDPDAFAETARTLSDDGGTAADGGEVGWIAPYQLDPMHEQAVFDLTEVGEVSEPIQDADGTLTIYQLLETSESRTVEEAQRSAISGAGFERWLDQEVRAGVETWVDPQFEPAAGG
ncbi:MAG: peptidylprolyl isomerase [Chloroflexi bacterium]|nr:peptidylprolyl isomerase [Chloroflexota bacterium]